MRGRRAYTEEDRARVQQAFINAGRRILASQGAGAMSMRQIAAESGYSPASIYQYFHDQRDLIVAIRDLDMNAATDAMEEAVRHIADPTRRVREVFMAAAQYWLEHPDHFDVLFSGPPRRQAIHTIEGTPFGRSASVLRSLALYTRVVDEFLASLPSRPIATCLAVDTLIAAVHGVIAFPRVTPGMSWSSTVLMVECVIDALVDRWTSKGKR
jgi:AcrR family transcriptional regulator